MAKSRESTDEELVVEHLEIVDTESGGTETEETSTDTGGGDGVTWHGDPTQPPPPPPSE